MKVFISWSGKLSQKIAKELSEWLPSIIQTIEVFYSPDDIKKGENWDSRLTNCQTAHCGRHKLHFAFGSNTFPIVPYRHSPQALCGLTADCRSFV